MTSLNVSYFSRVPALNQPGWRKPVILQVSEAWIHPAIVTLLGPHGASESENYQTEFLFHFLSWQRAARSLLFSELHLY